MLSHKNRWLTHKYKVCEKRFEVDHIVKYYRHIINENEVFRLREKGTPGALPRFFFWSAKRSSKLQVMRRTSTSPKNVRSLSNARKQNEAVMEPVDGFSRRRNTGRLRLHLCYTIRIQLGDEHIVLFRVSAPRIHR